MVTTQTLPENEVDVTETKAKAVKHVYFFGAGKADGNGKMKDELGGKGAGLAEMTNAGLPVPPGFTATTEACNAYYDASGNHRYHGKRLMMAGKAVSVLRIIGRGFLNER